MRKIFDKNTLKRIPWTLAAIILLAVISVIVTAVVQAQSGQSTDPIIPEVNFYGEYRVGGGEWRPISEKEHISAAGGAVELRGVFWLYDAESGEDICEAEGGSKISMYLDHVKVTITDESGNVWISDNENEHFGKSACAQVWTEYVFEGEAGSEVYITITTPHAFGNGKAVDSFLKNLCIYKGQNDYGMLSDIGPVQLAVGVLLIALLFVLLGVSLFASLLRRKHNLESWLMWLLIFFGGIYFIFSWDKISLWNRLYAANTLLLGFSMMMYVLTAYAVVASFLKGALRKTALWATAVLGALTLAVMLASAVPDVRFYDTYPYWVSAAVLGALVLVACMCIDVARREEKSADGEAIKSKKIYIPAIAVLLAFIADAAATLLGAWQGGAISISVFLVIVLVSVVMLKRGTAKSIGTLLDAKNIEAEKKEMELKLQESHISIMLSQIQPHFLYNTLNSIYQLCETNPMLARSMVNSFAEYLRNNLSSLDEPGLVSFETELSHIKTYLDIEKIRFDDTLEIEYDINCTDFSLPVLTVQPIVENAVKHGTSKKRGGGKVTISTLEDSENYIISVSDTGCGFDPAKPKNDGKRHVGIENVRQRLSNMCAGSLTIKSVVGEGTNATIKIPKGGKK